MSTDRHGRPWRVGDVVRVRRGRLAGAVGTVCAVATGGLVGLKITSVRRVHWVEPWKLERVEEADAS
jgi:hypothetical protein